MKKINNGKALHKLSRNGTEFRVGALFQLPKIEELPDSFVLGQPIIKYQADSDFCSGFASSGAREFQEGVELCPEWSFAKSKEISGDIDTYGQNLKDACKVHVKFGAIEKSQSPFSLSTQDSSFLRDIKNWPKLDSLAEKHLASSYLEVASFSDHFDTIRKTIWRFREERRAIVIGVEFGWSLTDKIMDMPQGGSGHAMYVIGWEKINDKFYLKVVNSYGEEAGENGMHCFSREVINQYVQDYGAFMFVDMPPEKLIWLIENNGKVDGNWITPLINSILTFLKTLVLSPFLTLSEKSHIVTTISETVNTIEESKIMLPEISHSDAWCGGTLEERLKMYQLAKIVGQKIGLSDLMMKDYLATIYGESGFNQWCVNNNTKDYGIAQFSAKYYLVEYKMTPQEAVDQPEKCLEIMARNFKLGRASNWVAYSSDGYKRWLDKKPGVSMGNIESGYREWWTLKK